jgi:uncharacterized protein YbjT (DUF2867 family)
MAAIKVLVTGATGAQGGALARLLLDRGHQVRAFSRRPDSPDCRELERRGAQIIQGDFEDRRSLEEAMRGVDAVFAMATPYEAGPEAETRQARTIVDAVKSAGVRHLVYSSVSDADRDTGIPHFDSKARVEEHIQDLGVPYTIVAPVWFFDNYFSPWLLPGLQKGVLSQPMPADRMLQGIAVVNVASFAALVLENRDRFLGQRINIASDELPAAEYARVISRVSGREIKYVELPLEEVRKANEDTARMYGWFTRVGYSADIEGLRREYPSVGWLRFEEWARRQDWRALKEAASA